MKILITFLFGIFLVSQMIDTSYSQSVSGRRSVLTNTADGRIVNERFNKHLNERFNRSASLHPVKQDIYKYVQERLKQSKLSPKSIMKMNNISVEPEWAVRYASGTKFNPDLAYDLVTDNDGNTYVTGEISSDPYGIDYAVIKYSPTGVQQWLVTYDGGGDDIPAAIAIDGDNNLYVTGQSQGTNETGFDITTVKYNSSGVQQWVTRYESTYDESPTDITLDAFGNIFIIGSYFGANWDDFLTIKYNSSGQQEWVQTYNGPVDFVDFPTAIVTDADGNAYVTGVSYGSSYNLDWLTFKFSPSGDELWSVRYNGTGNSDDYALAMTIDDTSNVYITGSQNQAATSDDYMTIKYDSEGNQKWSAVYNGTGNQYDHSVAIALDGNGSVIVLGISYSATDADYTTIKYTPAGSEQWVVRYNGPGGMWDYPTCVVVDANNDIIVSGTSAGVGTNDDFTCIKYNSSGSQQWLWRNDICPDYEYLYSMSLDAAGNIYAAGYSVNGASLADITTVKLNSSGVQQWMNVFDGPKTSYDDPFAMTVDSEGNTYVTGRSQGIESYDYLTVKYNNAGVLQWAVRYDGTGNGEDWGLAIAVDANGNVFVTGSSDGLTSRDFATVKYNSDGVQQWAKRYDGPSNDFDEAFYIAIDPDGYIYVAGRSPSVSGPGDYLLIKYNQSGNEQWTARYNGEEDNEDYVTGMVIDNAGFIYLTGRSYNSTTMDDYLTIKYSPEGTEMWTAGYDGGNAGYEWPEAITLDGSGNVYVVGTVDAGVNSLDLAVIKYNSDGVQQWEAQYNGAVSYEELGNSIVVDESGNVYVSGYTYGEMSCDLITIKYSPDGDQLWTVIYDDPYGGDDFNDNIMLTPEGGIYVSGRVYGDLGTDDVYIVRYSADGIVEWEAQYNGPVNTADFSVGMGLDNDGNIYTAGRIDHFGWAVYSILKYTNPVIPVELTSFAANAEGDKVLLNWRTASETNNYGYEIERKTDSEQSEVWKNIGFIAGSGTTTEPRSYSFTDKNLSTGKYCYRLKQVDFDGKFEYSDVIEVDIKVPLSFSLSQNYPNPFNPATIIKYTIPENGRVKLVIYNALGQQVAELINRDEVSGNYEVNFNADNLSSGVYYYKITVNDYSAVKKMILLR